MGKFRGGWPSGLASLLLFWLWVSASPIAMAAELEQGLRASTSLEEDLPEVVEEAHPEYVLESEGVGSATLGDSQTILAWSGLLVAAVTLVFGFAMSLVGYFNFKGYREQRNALVEILTQADEAAERVQQAYAHIMEFERIYDDRLATMRESIEAQGKAMDMSLRFFNAVWLQYSGLLTGVVEELSGALRKEEEAGIKAAISEAEACLDLFNPEEEEVYRVLRRLEVMGGARCVPALHKLLQDSSASPEVRLRSQAVLLKVKERLKAN